MRAAGKRLVVATPRILKPDEQRLWLFYLRLGADALLLRSAGLLQHLMALGGPGAVWQKAAVTGACRRQLFQHIAAGLSTAWGMVPALPYPLACNIPAAATMQRLGGGVWAPHRAAGA